MIEKTKLAKGRVRPVLKRITIEVKGWHISQTGIRNLAGFYIPNADFWDTVFEGEFGAVPDASWCMQRVHEVGENRADTSLWVLVLPTCPTVTGIVFMGTAKLLGRKSLSPALLFHILLGNCFFTEGSVAISHLGLLEALISFHPIHSRSWSCFENEWFKNATSSSVKHWIFTGVFRRTPNSGQSGTGWIFQGRWSSGSLRGLRRGSCLLRLGRAGTVTGLCCAVKVGERAAVHQVEPRIENSTWTWYFARGLGITVLSSQAFSSGVLHNKINVFCTFSV